MIALPAGAQTVQEQTVSYDFRGESLEQVLDAIARDSGIDLVYDPELVRGQQVFKRIESSEVTEALRLILFDLNLDYIILSSGTVVIIRRVESAPAFGTLSGIIVDSQTGEPLPGATVMFADAAGGTSTGQMGQFSINRLMSGSHTLIFSYVGYSAVTKQITISPGRHVQETIEMRPQPVDVAPVIVEAHRPQLYNFGDRGESGSFGFDSYEWTRGPVQDLAMIPGVKSGVPMSDISLQGGQESEHRVMLDGVPMYSPYTIGRLFSSFSPYAIGSVEVQRAGYDASQGSQIAGLIDMSHHLPPKGQKGVMFQADPVSINLRGDLSYSLKNQSSVSVMSAFRTNIWSVYRDPVLEETLREWDVIDPLITNSMADIEDNAAYFEPYNHQSDLSFHDFHTAVRYKPNTYNTVQLSVYDSDNSLGTAVLNRSLPGQDIEPYLYAAETYSWNNRMAQLSWNSLPTPRLGIDSQISYTRSLFSHSSELGFGIPLQFRANSETSFSSDAGGIQFDRVELPSDVKGNEIEHFIVKSDASFSFSPSVELLGGIQFDRVSNALDSGEEGSLPPISDVTSSMLSGYLSGSFRFGRYWHLNAGSRFTHLDKTSRVYAEPRMSLQVDRPEAGIGYWSGKISGGLYRQFINEYRVSNSGATSVVPSFSIWSHAGTLPIPKAYHLTGSWYLEPSEKSTLRIEGYLKLQPVTSITSYRGFNEGEGETDVDVFAETTKMRAYGAGIRYERTFFESKLKLLSGYDYSYATIDMDTQFSRSVSTPWNDPHRGQFRAVWNIFNDLTLIGKWQGVWGRTWAFRDSYYSYLQVFEQESMNEFDFGSPDDDNLSHFSQADLSVLYRPELEAAKLLLRLDFINILNRRNVIDHRLSPVFKESDVSGYDITRRTLPGFYPKFSLKVSL
ncbi:TonB-dependent receptor [Rhodohalobacter sp. 8-1]|uniref:TonB-dependent receptor n=1 Tax=Rhodohalobacter sp. 8-1 TaxID=3131972 RepID=UPI0030EF93A6